MALSNQADHADRMLSAFPSIISILVSVFSLMEKELILRQSDDTIGGHFLHLLHGKKPSELYKIK